VKNKKLKDILEKIPDDSQAVKYGHVLIGYHRWVGGNLT